MGTTEYIGARYVPKFYENSDGSNAWRAGVIYEPLTIVTYNSNSYTSKKPVPATVGNPSDNPAYWVATGVYNEQIASLQNDVNQIKSDIVGIDAEPVNVLRLGVKNDGSEDCSTIVNTALLDYDLYFPNGTYRFDSPIVLNRSICGAPVTGRAYNGGAILIFNVATGSDVIINEAVAIKNITVANITIDSNNNPVTALSFTPSVRVQLNIDHVTMRNCKFALEIAPTFRYPQSVQCNNMSAYALSVPELYNDILETVGVTINTNAPDCVFNDIRIFGFRNGFRNSAGGQLLSLVNIYPENGGVPSENKDAYFSGTICIDAQADIMCDTCYLDSAYQLAVQRAGVGIYGKVFSWYDTWITTSAYTDGCAFSTRGTARMVVEYFSAGGNMVTQAATTRANVVLKEYRSNFTFDTRKPTLYPPMGYHYVANSIHQIYTANGEYFEVARVAVNGWGAIWFRCTFETVYADFDIRFRGAGEISSITKSGTNNKNFFYKFDGNFLIIYMQNASYTNLTLDTYLHSVAGPVFNGLMSPIAHNYTPASQTDATGLTAIA